MIEQNALAYYPQSVNDASPKVYKISSVVGCPCLRLEAHSVSVTVTEREQFQNVQKIYSHPGTKVVKFFFFVSKSGGTISCCPCSRQVFSFCADICQLDKRLSCNYQGFFRSLLE